MMYGVDVGGTKIELAIFDDGGKKRDSWRVPTPLNDYSDFLSTIKALIVEADRKTQSQGSVGIGLPGFVDSLGTAISANIPCINGKHLADDISALLSRPIGFENDVKAFVYSEANGGAAEEEALVLGVVLGTGVAGGLCINGELYKGRQNIAGEYGHIGLASVLRQKYGFPVRKCGCGLVGCTEQYLSGPGLLWMSEFLGGKFDSVAQLIDAMRDGHAGAEDIFSSYLDCLGCFFADLSKLFDPDVIVLGGGLSNIDEIYQRVPSLIDRYLFDSVSPPKVVPPRFGDSSGVRGVAMIGRDVMLANSGGER